MQNLIDKHVQLIVAIPQLNNYCGILQLSAVGEEFIKLVPWDAAYQLTHKIWVSVAGEVHIRKQDIRGIIDIDTVNDKAIAELSKDFEGIGTGSPS